MNRGYGLWKEYSAEIEKYLRLLTNAGYTVIFIGHEGTREQLDDKGVKYDKIYPRGDKRVVDPITDLCDFICYARQQPCNEKGEFVNSTLYLKGTTAFHAGSRFTSVTAAIPEWSLEKLEKAISDAIQLEEKNAKTTGISYEQLVEKEAKAAESKWTKYSMQELRDLCAEKGSKIIEQTGSPDAYTEIVKQEFGTADFKATQATDSQRKQVEQLLEALEKAGY